MNIGLGLLIGCTYVALFWVLVLTAWFFRKVGGGALLGYSLGMVFIIVRANLLATLWEPPHLTHVILLLGAGCATLGYMALRGGPTEGGAETSDPRSARWAVLVLALPLLVVVSIHSYHLGGSHFHHALGLALVAAGPFVLRGTASIVVPWVGLVFYVTGPGAALLLATVAPPE